MVWRRVVQLTALGLLALPAIWPANTLWLGTYVSSAVAGVALTDPLAALEVSLAGKTLWWPLVLSALPLVAVAAIGGRIFCGWVCPLNTVFELTGGKTARTANSWWSYRLLALALVLSAALSLPIFTLLSPIGIVSRVFSFAAGIEILLIAALVAAERFEGKGWCRQLCPAGALYGLLGRWRGLNVVIDRKRCSGCGECDAACSMRVKAGAEDTLNRLNCTNCGDCIDACKDKAVAWRWNQG